MISKKHKAVFLHIPKTAGTSIEAKLKGVEQQPEKGFQDHRSLREIIPITLKQIPRILNKRHEGISRKKVIHNYVQTKRDRHINHDDYKTYFKFTIIRNPWDRCFSWYRNTTETKRTSDSFADFLRNSRSNWALRPQLYWLKNWENKVELDFIGRFESLNEDLQFISQKLNLKDQDFPHHLDTKKLDYRDYYTEELVELVRELYAEEIELFGYNFEGY